MSTTIREAGDICPDCETVGLPGALCPRHARAENTMSRLAAVRTSNECRRESRRSTAIGLMRRLAERLATEADRLEADPTWHPAVKVCQGDGAAIDEAVAELGVLCDVAKEIEWLARS